MPDGHLSEGRLASLYARRLFLSANFRDPREGEVRRISILRTSVHNPRICFAFIADTSVVGYDGSRQAGEE
jgi:hypothetical protein